MSETDSHDNALREELKRFFAQARLPTSPTLAVQILDLAADPTSTVDQFAELLRVDPVLSGRLLNLANSAHCAQRTSVTTIQRAVALLGINRVRTVSLGFKLVGHLDRLCGCPFDMKAFWQHSLLRGCLAREFAEVVVPACAEEAFLVGLLQDCGVLLLVQLLGADYAALCESNKLSPTAFHAAERARFRHNHVEAIVALAREWQFPDVIVMPLERHHTPAKLSDAATDLDRLSAVAFLVGAIRLADDLIVDDSEPGLDHYAKSELDLDEDAVCRCLEKAGLAYAELAPVLSDSLPEHFDATELLSQANAHLTNAAGAAETRVHSIEAERDEIQRRQETLQSAIGEYRARAELDSLTGLLNRGALVDAVRALLPTGEDRSPPLVVLFIDLDNFKQLNDRLGHQIGDEVLKNVAAALARIVPPQGVVGRYGGEEFVAVAPGLSQKEAKRLADDVVAGVLAAHASADTASLAVTCSVGAVWGTPDRETTPKGLFAAADELMYEAKAAGKNQCSFRAADICDPAHVSPVGEGTEAPDSAAGRASGTALPDHAVFQRVAAGMHDATDTPCDSTRTQDRPPVFARCQIAAFVGAAMEIRSEDAYIRNLSTAGVGILTARALRRGEPIEVAIATEDRPTVFLAGVVVFCRYIESGVHHVGVRLTARGQAPVFSDDPIGAIHAHDWLAKALQGLRAAGSAAPTTQSR